MSVQHHKDVVKEANYSIRGDPKSLKQLSSSGNAARDRRDKAPKEDKGTRRVIESRQDWLSGEQQRAQEVMQRRRADCRYKRQKRAAEGSKDDGIWKIELSYRL